MRLRYSLVHLLMIGILMLSLPSQRGALATEGCSIEITRTSPSRLPQATKPGEIIVKFWFDLTTSDPRETQLNVEATGNNIDILSKTISMSTGSGSVRIYVHTDAGERASLTIRVSCRVNGISDSDSKDMGSSYIVYIPPSWSPSVSPREIGKRGEITLEADGLDDVDDGVGTLSVTAKVGSSTYRLRRVSRGLYRTEVSVNFVDSPSGTRRITFTVTKSYGGVTATSRKDATMRVLGDPPTVTLTSPSQIHRGDAITVVVSENDGDSLTGVLSAFGREYELKRGENSIEVPRDVDAGQHPVRATVEDVDGNNSGSWTLEILNVPPHVDISVDKDLAVPGDVVSAHVTVEDDSTGVSVELVVTGNGIEDRFELNESGGVVEFRVPDGFSGELTFTANAIDRDGASSSSAESVIVGMPPSISGDIPRVVHRGEEYTITIQGDEVSGYLEVMGERTSINGEGVYRIVIPREIEAGDHEISAYATSPFGEASERWEVTLENTPPSVDVSVSPSEALPGEIVTISASYSDDAPGLAVTLCIDGEAVQLSGSSSGEHVEFTVPDGKSIIEITIEAVDMDGAVARDSAVIVVRSGPDSDGGTGGDSGGGGNSSTDGGSGGSPGNITGDGEVGEVDEGEVAYDEQGSGDQTDSGSRRSQSSTGSETGESQRSTLVEAPQGSNSSIGAEDSEKAGEVNGTSGPTHSAGKFSITVVPGNPEVGDNVSVTVIPHGARGSVWVVDPSGSTVGEVPVRNRTTFQFVASKEGIWSIRWAYTSGGGTLFGHMELNVTAPLPSAEISHKARDIHQPLPKENTLTTPVKETRGEIRIFKPSCRVLREEDPRSWDIEVVTVVMAASLVGLLVVRRRVS